MQSEAVIEELRARLQLAEGSATLVLAVAESDASVPPVQQSLLDVLRAAPMEVADLGLCSNDMGPARWAELTRGRSEQAFVLGFVPTSTLATAAFARLANAERELLRRLGGPVVLVVSRATEKAIRQHAPDFFTWVAQAYELPVLRDLQALSGRLGIPQRPAAPAEEPIRFLHLSDLHLRPQRGKRYDQDRVLAGLLAFLERDAKSFPLDMILLTGDLAHSGKPEEYVLVVELLQRLMDVTAVPAERVFVVPGNHDVDREIGRWLLRTLSRDEDAIAFFVEPKSRTFHEYKLAAYADSLRPLLGAGRPLGIGVGANCVETFEIKGARLAVASFNTAWFAQGDDDHGKLWLGEPAVERASDRVADDDAIFAIALMHHPFDDLHEIERSVVEHWFERHFDMVCRGHLHANKTRSIASQRGGFVEVAAPAAYQGSPWPNGCFLGEIRPRGRTVTLRPYMYSSGPDPWVLDTRVFPDDERDGYRRTFTVPAKQRRKSHISSTLRLAAETAVKTASPVERAAIEQKLANVGPSAPAAARALAETPELWTEVLHAAPPALGFVSALERAVTENSTAERIEIVDNLAFKEVLNQASETFLTLAERLKARAWLREREATFGLAAILRTILSRKVVVAPRLAAGRILEPDILIVRSDSPLTGEVIEVKRDPSRDPSMVTQGLEQLDRYMSAARSEYGALVLLDVLPPTTTMPEISRVQTPGGRDVLLVRL